MARKPLEGTVAQNVLRYGTGGLNVDGCRVESGGTHGSARSVGQGAGYEAHNKPGRKYGNGLGGIVSRPHAQGRWPANLIHDGSEEVVRLFPSPHGAGFAREARRKCAPSGKLWKQPGDGHRFGDSGSAARFFYCAKASRADRNEGLGDARDFVLARSCQAIAEAKRGNTVKAEGGAYNKARIVKNHHPTVKPTALMRYLCRLVTPPGGLVLDPFCGSGSTGKAAVLEGFRFLGIELDPEYAEIAEARIAAAQKHEPLFSPPDWTDDVARRFSSPPVERDTGVDSSPNL